MITLRLPGEVGRKLEALAALDRVCDHRAIAAIQDTVLLILVVRIGNREDICRR